MSVAPPADPRPILAPPGPVDATIRVPGSKSLTNRLLVLAALAEGTSTLRGPLRSDDCDRLRAALGAIGVGIDAGPDPGDARPGGEVLEIRGVGGRPAGGATVDLGDGGTPTRFMLAVAALAAAPVTVDGSRRMRERPVAEGVELMRALGGRLESVGADGRLPIRSQPPPDGRLAGGRASVGATASSQFLSAALLVGPHARGGVELVPTAPLTSPSYVELTIAAMRRIGLTVEWTDAAIGVPAQPAAAFELTVPADASSAVYWWVAAALRPGWRVRTPGIDADLPQPDEAVLDLLARFGAIVERPAPDAVVVTGGDGLRPPAEPLEMESTPDAALAIAAMAVAADGPTTLTGLRTLRVKETDRIAALVSELARLGCAVEADDDRLRIDPSRRHGEPVTIRTYDDHRMAMAFAVLGLVRTGISIEDPGCVGKSYPGFWADLERVRGTA